MRRRLEKRAVKIAGDNAEWYCAAYYRVACRIDKEEKRPTGLNMDRLYRRLQALYHQIVQMLEADHKAQEPGKLAEQLINRCISDHHLPPSCHMHFDRQESEDEPAPPPEAA